MILSPDNLTDEINALDAVRRRGPGWATVTALTNEDDPCPDATFTAALPQSNSEPDWKPPTLSRLILPDAPGRTRAVSSDGLMARKPIPHSGSAGSLGRSPSRTRGGLCWRMRPKTSPAWDPTIGTGARDGTDPPDRGVAPSEPPGVALPWLLLAAAAELLALAVFVCWVAVAAIACGVL